LETGATAWGFTLIELVVSITVGAIISGTAGLLIMTAAEQRSSFSSQGRVDRQKLHGDGGDAFGTFVR